MSDEVQGGMRPPGPQDYNRAPVAWPAAIDAHGEVTFVMTAEEFGNLCRLSWALPPVPVPLERARARYTP